MGISKAAVQIAAFLAYGVHKGLWALVTLLRLRHVVQTNGLSHDMLVSDRNTNNSQDSTQILVHRDTCTPLVLVPQSWRLTV